MKKTKLPVRPRIYPNDTNLLSFMFSIARNDSLLALFLHEIQFIRQHPMLTEEQVRHELELDKMRNMPVKPLQ
jgi:hypothetical protein